MENLSAQKKSVFALKKELSVIERKVWISSRPEMEKQMQESGAGIIKEKLKEYHSTQKPDEFSAAILKKQRQSFGGYFLEDQRRAYRIGKTADGTSETPHQVRELTRSTCGNKEYPKLWATNKHGKWFIFGGDLRHHYYGIRPNIILTFNPKSLLEVEMVDDNVCVDACEQCDQYFTTYVDIKKPVTFVPLVNGIEIPMQIENFNDIKDNKTKYYHLKALESIKRLTYGNGRLGLKYPNSVADRECTMFENMLAPEVRKDLWTVVMDGNKDYEIIDCMAPEIEKNQHYKEK